MADHKIVRLTDGGFGTHLQSYVGDEINNPLWSAKFNVTRPAVVLATHRDFLAAGADLIRTNTYQASVEGYVKHLGLSEEQARAEMVNSVRLALRARDEQEPRGNSVQVLASIGPFGAWLNDGSEYSGSYGDSVPAEVIREFHKSRLDLILESPVDGLAIETIPIQREAEIIVDLLNEFNPQVKFWVSFSCKDKDSLVHGEDFGEAVESIWARVANKENIIAIGVNCLDPKLVTPLFAKIENDKREQKIPLIAYPNSGEVFDTEKRIWMTQDDCRDFVEYFPEWVRLGAKYLGGCCRNDANRIKVMRECIDKELKSVN